VGLLGLVYKRQERLIFFPEPLPADFPLVMPDVEDVRIRVDGATLSALHLKLPQPKGVVFFLHGNAGIWPTGSPTRRFSGARTSTCS